MLKVWLRRYYRFIFGIAQFNKKEVKELKILFEKHDFELYSYKIFERVKTLANGKYTVIDDNFYYNNLAPIMARNFHRFMKDSSKMKYSEFQKRILNDMIFVESSIEHVEITFSGSKITAK